MEAATPAAYVPIIVGISGKRDLNGKEGWARERLDAAFSAVEACFPSSPLVLLTGLAAGADTIAAEAALAHRRWDVVALLPFDRDLYLEDFPVGSHERARLEAILDGHDGRVIVKTMPRLRDDHKQTLPRESLHRSGSQPNELRRQHYEQAGLAIADRCSLLITIMRRGEPPEKIGGTARIKAFKETGAIDDDTERIMARSDEIVAPELLDQRMRGLVYLIDLDGTTTDFGERMVPQEVGDAWQSLLGIERFNRRLRAQQTVLAEAPPPSALALINADASDPARDYAGRVRSAMAGIQRSEKKSVERVLIWLASIFVASILALQTYETVKTDWYWLYETYVALGLIGLLSYGLMRMSLSQLFAEDYRGAAEAIRIQVEWWRLGLRGPLNRVDRYYLSRAEHEFAVLRRNIKAGLDAAELLSTRVPEGGEPLDLHSETAWIPTQIAFFRTTGERRERSTVRYTSAAWFLFQLSIGMAMTIGALVWPGSADILRNAIPKLPPFFTERAAWLAGAVAGIIAVRLLLLMLVRVRFPPVPKSDPEPPTRVRKLWRTVIERLRYVRPGGKVSRPHSGSRGWLLALPLGVAAVPAVVAVLLAAGLKPDAAAASAKGSATLVMIMLAVVAAAIRFVQERRGLEWEAHAYRDMRAVYELGREHARKARDDKGSVQGHATAAANATAWLLQADQNLGRELGRAALTESEGWLRAHRERPIEPLV